MESTSYGAMLACYFSQAVFGSMVPTSDSQISDVIFLNPNFTTFSSKINVQITILKEFSFHDVWVVSISGKQG